MVNVTKPGVSEPTEVGAIRSGIDCCIDCGAIVRKLRQGVCPECFDPRLRRLRWLIRRVLVAVWSHRPVVTTNRRWKDAIGIEAGKAYRLGRTSLEVAPVPASPEVRQHAERVTSTGARLVAVI
jgi:NMD protein affecting ribosome stability and mRNA decay